MSSTNRGGQRSEADWYATPPWVIHRLLDELHHVGIAMRDVTSETSVRTMMPSGRWLEPCAGDGELIRTVNSRRSDVVWSACELREEMRSNLEPLIKVTATETLLMGDFLQARLDDFGGKKFNVAITNPPFSIALPVVKKCMELADMTIMLLRLNFWGSDERQTFMKRFPPHTYVLPNRPMFSLNKFGKPGTDSPEYAWMVWGSDAWFETATCGDIKVLNRTPKEERKVWTEHLKTTAPSKVEAPVSALEAESAAGILAGDRDL